STDRLILAAGTLGSTYLLLSNRESFPALSSALGSHFSGNGDLLTFAIRCTQEGDDGLRTPLPVDPSDGPVITGAIRVGDAADGAEGRGFYIEDAGYPSFIGWMLETSGAMGTLRRARRVLWDRLMSALGLRKDTNYSAEISYL